MKRAHENSAQKERIMERVHNGMKRALNQMKRAHNQMKRAHNQMKRAHKQMKGAHKDDCGTNFFARESVTAFHSVLSTKL